MNLGPYDWKKEAAQVVDDNAVERAFMDQAYGFLSNKAGKLMEDQHRLGFEVVYKNDSNTRMVGIFAFRINNRIVYVPVFFLNGEIKGTDLLYMQDTKTFKPLNEGWVGVLTEKSSYEPGQAISKKEFMRANNHVRLEDIAYPPHYKKAKVDDTDKVQTLGDVDDIFLNSHTKVAPAEGSLVDPADAADMLPVKKAGELLRTFIEQDGGADAVDKLASWMENSFAFTEALVTNIAEEDYMPQALPASVNKQASADAPALVLFTGGVGVTQHSNLLKNAAADDNDPAVNKFADKFFSSGYYLWDDRAPSDITPVYRDDSAKLELVGSAGVYDVIMCDGTFRQAVVGPIVEQDFEHSPSYGGYNVGAYSDTYNRGGVPLDVIYSSPPRHTTTIVCFLDGDKESAQATHVYGKFVKDAAQMIMDKDVSAEPSSGQAYRIFDAETGCISQPLYFKKVEHKDGIGIYTVVPRYGSSSLKTFRHNVDAAENDIAHGFLGRDAYFIPTATENFKETRYSNEPRADNGPPVATSTFYEFNAAMLDSSKLGATDTLDAWVKEYFKQASLIHDKDTDTFSWRVGAHDQSDYMPRMDIAVKLATAGIHADVVEVMLTETREKGTSSWYYGDPGMSKRAFPISISRDAVFRTTTDSDFQVNKEMPQSFVLQTRQSSQQVPSQAVGDAYDPGMGQKAEDGIGKDKLMVMSPDQIAQFASSNNLPNVFEHGLVGSLVKVYDSVSMIDKYLPDMESALDRLGRILFLFYWKPRDFEDAYGTDDMANLENQLLSNFKSFGALVLDLIKKSKKRKIGGNVSLGS